MYRITLVTNQMQRDINLNTLDRFLQRTVPLRSVLVHHSTTEPSFSLVMPDWTSLAREAAARLHSSDCQQFYGSGPRKITRSWRTIEDVRNDSLDEVNSRCGNNKSRPVYTEAGGAGPPVKLCVRGTVLTFYSVRRVGSSSLPSALKDIANMLSEGTAPCGLSNSQNISFAIVRSPSSRLLSSYRRVAYDRGLVSSCSRNGTAAWCTAASSAVCKMPFACWPEGEARFEAYARALLCVGQACPKNRFLDLCSYGLAYHYWSQMNWVRRALPGLTYVLQLENLVPSVLALFGIFAPVSQRHEIAIHARLSPSRPEAKKSTSKDAATVQYEIARLSHATQNAIKSYYQQDSVCLGYT